VKYYPIDTTFRYQDRNYLVAKPPRKFWKCQNCVFYENCGELFNTDEFPACMPYDRDDGYNVVFFEARPAKRRHREEVRDVR